jgi:N6-adenosine-specific RNA methylase IME4
MRYKTFNEITGKYKTIVIDPPWPISLSGEFKGKHKRPLTLPYPTMNLVEISSLDINRIGYHGVHIYLWTVNKFLRDAFSILEKWGVFYHITITMVKPSGLAPSIGYVFASEYCLMGFLGKPMIPFSRCGALNWIKNANNHGEHSRKPDTFYKVVEATSPGPRIDLFARRLRAGWDLMGNEIDMAQLELAS